MKKSEIRKLVAEYNKIKVNLRKTQNKKMTKKLKEIEQRYFHETGKNINSDFKEIT